MKDNKDKHSDKTEFSKAEIKKFRAETKGTKSKIHFNNAGASFPPDIVISSITKYLKEEAVTGGYEMESSYQSELENTYTLIAKMINADPSEIALTENAGIAWGLAFNGIDFENGDEIVTTEMEYVTNLLAFHNVSKTKGVKITTIANDRNGDFDLQQFEKSLTPRTKMIAVTHISSSNGLVMPINDVGKIARDRGILYMVDACQSIGQYPVDVDQINCDILSATGRKYLRAPRGTGFLYIRKEVQNKIKPILIDWYSVKSISLDGYELRDDARRYELFEKSRALNIGLGKAVAYATNIGLERIWARITFLSEKLRTMLSDLGGVVVHDIGKQKCGIVTFSLNGLDSLTVKNNLNAQGINLSIGTASATLVFMEKNKLADVLRVSVHYYNTEDELVILCDALKKF